MIDLDDTLGTKEWGALQDPPVAASNVRRWCERWIIPEARKVGRDWRIPKSVKRPPDGRGKWRSNAAAKGSA